MLPEILKTLRSEKGISQASLASLLGLSQQAIAKWETGNSEPDSDMLNKLASFFSVSVDYLLGRTNVRNSNNSTDEFPPEAQVLMRSVAKLTDKQKEIIKKLVQEFIDED
jgi:transcriptional regulator with XRE-family HTH domain